MNSRTSIGIPVKTDILGWDISHSPKFSWYGGKRFNHCSTPERHKKVIHRKTRFPFECVEKIGVCIKSW